MSALAHRGNLTPDQVDLTVKDIDKFWAKVDIGAPDECWNWKGARLKAGYGTFYVPSVQEGRGAHRIAAQLILGPPTGLVLHSCDNPPCCNPGHLRYGTQAENVADAMRRRRHSHGESQGLARLTGVDVAEMRRLYALGVGTPELGRRFGVHTATAHRVVTRKTWRHIA